MRMRPMTTRGLLIAIAIEGIVLGACISFPWLVVVPLVAAIVFVPQAILIAGCAYLATRESDTRGFALPGKLRVAARAPGKTTSPEIWYIEMNLDTIDPGGIVFPSSPDSPNH
jgi:hypothetical protein